jgi:predicted RNA-binding Zn-ribbon protein involved in translation (DUF1610 family)
MSQLAIKFDPAEETGWYYICHKCNFKGPQKDFQFRDEDYGFHGTIEIIICPKCGADSDDKRSDGLSMVWFLEFVP